MSSTIEETDVIIVGGSLVGLSTALFVADRGLRTILVEKHRDSLTHPRAVGFTELTLEHYRAVGIADRIPQIDAGARLRRVRAESLSGEWHEETAWTPGEKEVARGTSSPCTGAAIAQDKLEPILRQAAEERGADLRQGVEMLSFDQDDEGVQVRVRERDSGREYELRGRYMVAADGASSAIRTSLGIERTGIGHLETIRSVLFNCPAAEHFIDRGVQQFEIDQPGFKAFLVHYPDGRWALLFNDDEDRNADELHSAIQRALGDDLPIEIITTGRWELAGRIAKRYSKGRVFLAGDAAHQLPPTRGGFGANTGIDDAWNLAWKLALVLNGVSSSSLLDTYSVERQPIGWLRHQQTFARPDYRRWAGDLLAGEPLLGTVAMELGQRVYSSAVVSNNSELPLAADPAVWAGQPGTRAPHVWVESAGETVSTVDLLTRSFCLLSEDPDWTRAAKTVAVRLGIEFETIQVGKDISFPIEQPFGATFEVDSGGALLVRPDGIVAWRTNGSALDAHVAMENALMQAAAITPT